MREEPVEEKRPEDGSADGAQGERGDADALDQQHAPDDGPEAVDEGRHSLDAELLAHHENRAEDAAGEEAQLRGQQNAGELYAQRGFLRVETMNQ